MSLSQQLQELAALHASGSITDAEFAAAKARILNAEPPAAASGGAERTTTIQLTKKEYKIEKVKASLLVIGSVAWMFIGSVILGSVLEVLRVPAGVSRIIAAVSGFAGLLVFFYGVFRYMRVRGKIWLDHE